MRYSAPLAILAR